MTNTFGAALKWSDVLNDARCVALGTKGSPRYMKLILLLNILVLAVSLTSCTRKRKDFETAKAVVARELRLPGTAHFCALDQAEFSTRNGLHAVKLWVETWPERSFARTLKSRSILRVAWWRARSVSSALPKMRSKS